MGNSSEISQNRIFFTAPSVPTLAVKALEVEEPRDRESGKLNESLHQEEPEETERH
jgi:hypothetical protein